MRIKAWQSRLADQVKSVGSWVRRANSSARYAGKTNIEIVDKLGDFYFKSELNNNRHPSLVVYAGRVAHHFDVSRILETWKFQLSSGLRSRLFVSWFFPFDARIPAS